MTKSVILKSLMTTFLIIAAVVLVIRACHRFVMRSVDEHGHTAPISENLYRDHRGHLMHQDFKRRSKV